MPLAGKRIIVTGAATGIGRATALAVASRGAQVAAFDVNDGGRIGRRRCHHRGGRYGTVLARGRIGRGRGAGSGRRRDRVARRWSRRPAPPRRCPARAPGSTSPSSPRRPGTGSWTSTSRARSWSRSTSPPRMQQNGAGVIVLTASGAGVTGGSSSYAYGSSKGGVHGLAMVLRGQLADRGVRVNDVCPGQCRRRRSSSRSSRRCTGKTR